MHSKKDISVINRSGFIFHVIYMTVFGIKVLFLVFVMKGNVDLVMPTLRPTAL